MPKTYPVDYRKGDDVRQANSRRDETKLKFDGFRPVATASTDPEPEAPSYADLVERAKDLKTKGHDIKAGGVSYDELLATVSDAQADQDELDTLESEGGLVR